MFSSPVTRYDTADSVINEKNMRVLHRLFRRSAILLWLQSLLLICHLKRQNLDAYQGPIQATWNSVHIISLEYPRSFPSYSKLSASCRLEEPAERDRASRPARNAHVWTATGGRTGPLTNLNVYS